MLLLIIICFVAGCFGAILQGMLGIGTGVIVVPLLIVLLPKYGISSDIAMHMALATSMASIAMNSISAFRSHYYNGNIHWSLCKKILIFSMTGAGVGALVAGFMPGIYLQLLFACVLVWVASYMLLNKRKSEYSTIPEASNKKIIIGGLSVGVLASLIGSGGGIVMVPFLNSLKLNMRYAVGTSTVMGFPIAVTGSILYMIAGLSITKSIPMTIGYLYMPAFLAITVGGWLSAPIGVKYANFLHTNLLRRLFSVLIIIIGVRMMLQLVHIS